MAKPKPDTMKLKNVGQGENMGDDDSGEQWVVLESPRGKIVLVEHWFSAHYDSTEISSEDGTLSKDDLLQISERVGDLWRSDAPTLKDYVHFNNMVQF